MENRQAKNILFLINSAGLGGAEQVFLRQAQYFRQSGWQVEEGILAGNNKSSDSFNFDFHHLFDLAAYWRLLKFLQDNKINFIYATLDRAIFVARVAKIFSPHLTVVIRESGMANRKSWKMKLADIIFNILVKKIIAVSKEVKDSLSRYQPFFDSKIAVISNGVDIIFDLATLRTRRAVLQNKPLVILHVGSMYNKNKGQEQLIKTFIDLSAGSQDLILWLVGDGKYRESLMQKARTAAVEDKVKFWGEMSKEQLNDLYLAADIFVLNSQNEGCPNVVLEAMSFALPIVTSRVGGIEDLIEPEVSGLIFPVGDQSAMQKQLQRLLEDKDLRERFGQAAYQKVKNNLTWEQQNAKVKALFTT